MLNQIFRINENYGEKADFANANGYIIVEIEPDENGRRFQIQELPQPTQKQLAQREIAELEEWFKLYDIQVTQYQRSQRLGYVFDKDITELDALAVQKAARIKELRNEQ